MKNPTRVLNLASSILLGLLFLTSGNAYGEFTMVMEGTVVTGSLNGNDLANRDFVYSATITNPVDIDNVLSNNGAFVIDSASIDFGSSLVFDFGVNAGFFNWGISSDDFYAYIWDSVEPSTSTYLDGFGFAAYDAGLSGFDDSQLTNFGPYSEFDEGFTFNDQSVGIYERNNGLGDMLTLSRIGNSGTLTIAAIPEPGAVSACIGIFAGVALQRCRRVFPGRRRQTA